MAVQLITQADTHVLTVTANGYGKLTLAADYPQKGRGTMGVISIQTTTRNGAVVCALPVTLEDQILIATVDGQLIRMKVGDISVMGRNTQGVRLFSIDDTTVRTVTRLPASVLEGAIDGTDADVVDANVEEAATLPMDATDAETDPNNA